MKNYFAIFATLGILILCGAGCGTNESSKPLTGAQSQVKTLSESDFLNRIMQSTSTWRTLTDEKSGVSFQYPEGFFTHAQRYGDQDSGMEYSITVKPAKPENGVCDGLGDVDCDLAMWPKRYSNFKLALKGEKYVYGPYEAIVVAQSSKTIHNIKFLRIISQGLNQSCVLSYVTATKAVYASFDINICDDPNLNVSRWQGSVVSEQERRKVDDILSEKNLSESTRTKIQALERVLTTIKIR